MQADGSIVTELGSATQALAMTWGLRILGAVAVLVLGLTAAKWLRRLVRRGLGRTRVEPTVIPFLTGLVYWLAVAFVGVAVLGLFGIPTASLVAVLGAAGLAVGLAMQGTLSNFAAGVMLLVFRPFNVGDFVEVAGTEGKVREMGIFFTELTTRDNRRVTVPNSEIFGTVITNFTANDIRRIDLMIGVGYEDDLSVAAETMHRVLASVDGVLDEPEPVVEVHELAGSSVNFVVRPWCRTEEYWSVRWALTRRLKEKLEGAGCNIPYQQHDVHLFREEGAEEAGEPAGAAS